MKIGIGCLTYNRPKHLELWKKQMDKYCPKDSFVYIAEDTDEDRKGIAFRSNECLSVLTALKGSDYIFLFNDDCFPIKEGWVDFFISAYQSSGQHHFNYLRETPTIRKIGSENGIDIFNNTGGCFSFYTKEVIEKVGGYHQGYGRYGMEHCGYTNRIHQAGLTPMGMYLSVAGADEYLYAMDYQFNLPFNKLVNHKSSMPAAEMISEIQKNNSIFATDIKTIYQPL